MMIKKFSNFGCLERTKERSGLEQEIAVSCVRLGESSAHSFFLLTKAKHLTIFLISLNFWITCKLVADVVHTVLKHFLCSVLRFSMGNFNDEKHLFRVVSGCLAAL